MNEVARTSQVVEMVNLLEKAISDREETQIHLRERLSSVMRQDPAELAKTPSEQESLVPLADQLRELIRRINVGNEVLRSFLDLLEL